MGPLTPKRVRVDEVIDEGLEEKGPRNGMILEASRPRAPVLSKTRDDGSSDEDTAVGAVGMGKVQDGPSEGFSDLYLDTINR